MVQEKQTALSEYDTNQVGLNTKAYSILRTTKNQLITKHKKNFTFSDAVIELDKRRKGVNITFSNREVIQIKSKLGYAA